VKSVKFRPVNFKCYTVYPWY